jgi:hypothetical protein
VNKLYRNTNTNRFTMSQNIIITRTPRASDLKLQPSLRARAQALSLPA